MMIEIITTHHCRLRLILCGWALIRALSPPEVAAQLNWSVARGASCKCTQWNGGPIAEQRMISAALLELRPANCACKLVCLFISLATRAHDYTIGRARLAPA